MADIKRLRFGDAAPAAAFCRNALRQGFTLLETMVVVAIFGIVMTVGSTMLISGMKLYRTGVKQQDSLVKMTMFIGSLKKYLNNASLIRLTGTAGEYVDFQVPTNIGGQLLKEINESNCTPFWGDGINRNDGKDPIIYQIRLKFIKVGNTIQESVENCDLNRDGDKTDEYEAGYLEKVSISTETDPPTELAGTRENITYGNWLLRKISVEPNPFPGQSGKFCNLDRLFIRVNAQDEDTYARTGVTEGHNLKITAFTLERYAQGPVLTPRVFRIAPLNQESPNTK